MAADEQDLMAGREPDERAEESPLKDNAELPVESSSPGVDAARPDAAETGGALEEPTAEIPAATADVSEASPEAPVETEEAVASSEASAEAEAIVALSEAVESSVEPAAAADQLPAAPLPSEEGAPAAEMVSAAPEAPAPPADAAWYVIHCYSGYENKVRHNLEQRIETMGMKDRIFDVVIPTQEEIEVREGKRRTVERHIFPGYVLVNMTLSEESWYVVRNTPGVTGFVGMGNLPTALRPEEVAQIIKRMEAEAPTVKVSFKPGERVRIIDGPFNDFRGTVADLDMEHTKVRVMVSFFGRETPVELDFLQVEKA